MSIKELNHRIINLIELDGASESKVRILEYSLILASKGLIKGVFLFEVIRGS